MPARRVLPLLLLLAACSTQGPDARTAAPSEAVATSAAAAAPSGPPPSADAVARPGRSRGSRRAERLPVCRGVADVLRSLARAGRRARSRASLLHTRLRRGAARRQSRRLRRGGGPPGRPGPCLGRRWGEPDAHGGGPRGRGGDHPQRGALKRHPSDPELQLDPVRVLEGHEPPELRSTCQPNTRWYQSALASRSRTLKAMCDAPSTEGTAGGVMRLIDQAPGTPPARRPAAGGTPAGCPMPR